MNTHNTCHMAACRNNSNRCSRAGSLRAFSATCFSSSGPAAYIRNNYPAGSYTRKGRRQNKARTHTYSEDRSASMIRDPRRSTNTDRSTAQLLSARHTGKPVPNRRTGNHCTDCHSTVASSMAAGNTAVNSTAANNTAVRFGIVHRKTVQGHVQPSSPRFADEPRHCGSVPVEPSPGSRVFDAWVEHSGSQLGDLLVSAGPNRRRRCLYPACLGLGRSSEHKSEVPVGDRSAVADERSDALVGDRSAAASAVFPLSVAEPDERLEERAFADAAIRVAVPAVAPGAAASSLADAFVPEVLLAVGRRRDCRLRRHFRYHRLRRSLRRRHGPCLGNKRPRYLQPKQTGSIR